MVQYIDKDALVAGIERRKTNIKEYCLQEGHDARFDVVPEQLSYILSFIDTLEVKEVDSLTSEEIKKICTIYENLKQERECATVLYNSDETFFNNVLMVYKSIAQKGE